MLLPDRLSVRKIVASQRDASSLSDAARDQRLTEAEAVATGSPPAQPQATLPVRVYGSLGAGAALLVISFRWLGIVGDDAGARKPAEHDRGGETRLPTVGDGALLEDAGGLLTGAIAARQRGDTGAALAKLAELVRRYPALPLAENARIEQFRTLSKTGDRAGAGRLAQAYLALYTHGFARDEALSVVLEASPTP